MIETIEKIKQHGSFFYVCEDERKGAWAFLGDKWSEGKGWGYKIEATGNTAEEAVDNLYNLLDGSDSSLPNN